MIEILYDSAPPKDPKKPHNCHIIHIAMNEPDSSDRPFWNELQRCDDLTWATLPDALKKAREKDFVVLGSYLTGSLREMSTIPV